MKVIFFNKSNLQQDRLGDTLSFWLLYGQLKLLRMGWIPVPPTHKWNSQNGKEFIRTYSKTTQNQQNFLDPPLLKK